MHRRREHIARLHFPHLIAMLTQPLHISCQGGGVAAYVHDAFRLHFNHGFESGGITAFTGWVDNDDVSIDALVFVFLRKDFFCFSHEKFCVGDAIKLCVDFGIRDGLRHNLHTIYFSCFLCQEERNGADPAVEIPDSLISFEVCILQCRLI